jgi:hypothetical protein
MYSIQRYVIKFASDLRQVSGFLRVLLISSTNKTDRHDIAEILLKVALNTKPTKPIKIKLPVSNSSDMKQQNACQF